jgi:hypothetical protein
MPTAHGVILIESLNQLNGAEDPLHLLAKTGLRWGSRLLPPAICLLPTVDCRLSIISNDQLATCR